MLTFKVRSLSDSNNGVVVRSSAFLLINMNTLDSAGDIDGILTADFQGDELPTPDDLVLVGVACLGACPRIAIVARA